MKRSRTCLNLVELDTPSAAPKRTCSLPNLSWSDASSSSFGQSHRDTLLFLQQQHAAAEAAALSGGACARGRRRPLTFLPACPRRARAVFSILGGACVRSCVLATQPPWGVSCACVVGDRGQYFLRKVDADPAVVVWASREESCTWTAAKAALLARETHK